MNLLIIGGLLAIGLVAIAGAVLLSISEQRSQSAATSSIKQPILAERSEPPPAPRTVSEPTPPRTAGISRPTRRLAPLAEEMTHTSREGELPVLNGQFHEMAEEIRTLHQQAQQLEQRLSTLSEMIEHIEPSPSSYANIEEDVPLPEK